MQNDMLKQVLTWIIGGGGAGALTFLVMEKVPEAWTAEVRRYVSIGLAFVFAVVAFGLSVEFNYSPVPSNWQAWIEACFEVGFVACGLSQAIHGRAKLRK